MKRPGIFTGALVGALVTAPLIAVLYLAWQLAGLPFVPFDVFDWLARRLPGPIVTFGIDAMVSVIRALRLGEISATAKTAEQLLAIGGLFLTGIVAGAALFGLLRRGEKRSGILSGVVLGALLGVPLMLISLGVNLTSAAGPLPSAVWILLVFLAWGTVLGWSYDRLSAVETVPATEGAPGLAVERMDRRAFVVRLGGATAVITVVGAGVGVLIATERERRAALALGEPWSRRNPLPNAGAPVQPAQGTRPELTPVEDHYRIDINTRPPVVREEEWRLRIGGRVDRPTGWTLAEIRSRYEPLHQFITLSCISNPIAGDLISATRWTGVSLQRVLVDVGVQPAATHLRIRSVDDYHEVVALNEILADPRIMLTYAWDGLPLPIEHGFPLRVYIPDRYGMKQPKWIESIEAIDHWEAGYWVRRGWDREARMKTTSVIDVIASNMMIIEPGRDMVVPVGGMAHAGARGISRVEVGVDDGPWQQARLREPLSELTWVTWRFDWPFQPGEHTFTVRCFDRDGTPQVADRSPVRPSGATGLHSEDAMF